LPEGSGVPGVWLAVVDPVFGVALAIGRVIIDEKVEQTKRSKIAIEAGTTIRLLLLQWTLIR
jgi:hypothetical protein